MHDRAASRVDGRTARATRTRAAIVDAHLALIRDGDLRPTADRIAARAGVSLRALWGHFPDLEALFAATGERVRLLEEAAHEPVPAGLPRATRVDAFCRQRAAALERLAPVARAAALREPFSAALRRHRDDHLVRLRTELGTVFADEVAAAGAGGACLLTALTAVSASPTWATWRDAMGLDVDTARAALTRTVAALLDNAGAAP